jgi:hypothetical protein
VAGLYLMYFAVGLSGVGVLGVGLGYWLRPTERKLALMRPLSLASIFAALASLTAGWAYVLQGAAATPTWTAQGVQSLLMGSSQMLIPMFVTFAFLSVAWLFVAIGGAGGIGIARVIGRLRRRPEADEVTRAEAPPED